MNKLNRGRLNKNIQYNCLSGSINVDGIEYFIDVFPMKTWEGEKWYSIKVKRKDKQPQQEFEVDEDI